MSCTKEIVLPLDAERAWAAVTEEEALEAWLAEEVELELRPGGPARFTLPDGEERHGVVEEVAPGERLTFWWWPAPEDGSPDAVPPAPGSRVTFELVPAVAGTRVVVTETPVGPTASAAGRLPRCLALAAA
jgi:uncharacterized protein YndB with AHSA1/START domain